MRKIEVWWSEWKFYVPPGIQAVSNLSFYWLGWSCSTPTDSMPLARAGALATAVSIGFTLWRYSTILEKGNARGKAAFAKAIDAAHLPHIDKEAAKKNLGTKLDKSTAKIDQLITAVSVILLIIATLIWGFGDLAKVWR